MEALFIFLAIALGGGIGLFVARRENKRTVVTSGAGVQQDAGPAVTIGPTTFETARLRLEDAFANIHVVPGEGPMTVTVTGNKVFAEHVEAVATGDLLTVRNRPLTGSWRGTSHTVVTVRVPEGSPIDIDYAGIEDIRVENVRGPLTARLRGVANVILGEALDATIVHDGTGDIDVRRVDGDLNCKLYGVGNVHVADGRVRKLHVLAAGTGDVTFNGTAQDAELENQGIGNVRVREVTGTLRKQNRGIGDVTVVAEEA